MLEELHASEEPRRKRVGPPAVPPARQDWHKLETNDQGDIAAYQANALDLQACSLKAQWFLHRHFGAPTPAEQVRR